MDHIKEISDRYAVLEAEVDRRLERVKREEEKLNKLNADNNSTEWPPKKSLTYEEACTRNTRLLKSLEMAKAGLRSRSTFSPVEPILQKAIENYKKECQDIPPSRIKSVSQSGTFSESISRKKPSLQNDPSKLKSCLNRTKEQQLFEPNNPEAIYEVLDSW